ncbi:MAG: tetratricopeptide repeat protein [candidate division WOR-3 bacterium]
MTDLLLALLIALTSPRELFSRANAAYEAGDYVRSIALYDSASQSLVSADILFNRGNAYFKQGRIGRAIADYLRAHVLRPTDRDIRHNLAFCRQFRPDRSLEVENPLIRLLTDGLRLFSPGLLRIIAAVAFLFALASIALLLVSGRHYFGYLAIGLGVLFLYSLLGILSWNGLTDPNRAVVIVPEVVLRAGPGPEYKELAIVHDGLEVSIRERRPGFVLIQIPGGEGGWAEESAIEQVFPKNLAF